MGKTEQLTTVNRTVSGAGRCSERSISLRTLGSQVPSPPWSPVSCETAAVRASIDQLLHYGHVLKCGLKSRPKNGRTKPQPRRGWTLTCRRGITHWVSATWSQCWFALSTNGRLGSVHRRRPCEETSRHCRLLAVSLRNCSLHRQKHACYATGATVTNGVIAIGCKHVAAKAALTVGSWLVAMGLASVAIGASLRPLTNST
jgi:hypothetical protein